MEVSGDLGLKLANTVLLMRNFWGQKSRSICDFGRSHLWSAEHGCHSFGSACVRCACKVHRTDRTEGNQFNQHKDKKIEWAMLKSKCRYQDLGENPSKYFWFRK